MKNVYELTNPQKSIWLIEEYYKGTNINNICCRANINEKINLELLQQAINIVIKNNSSFLINFKLIDGKLMQYKTDYNYFDIQIEHVKSIDDVLLLEKKLLSRVFDIENSYLFEFKIFQFPDSTGGVILNIHHLLSDSWTLGLTCKQVLEEYNNLVNHSQNEVKYFDYFDFCASEKEYLQSEKFRKDKEYWESQFETIPEMATLPSFKTSSHENTCKAARVNFELSENIVEKINSFCKNNKISIFNFLISIYSLYIGRICNLDDFVIGTPILNRANFAEKNTTGMFISTVPLRIKIENEILFKEFATSNALNSMHMLRHQKYPYELIQKKLREQEPNLHNLYDILISYQITKAITDGLNYSTNWAFNGNCSDDLQIHILDANDTGKLNISYDYKLDKYKEQDIANFHYRIENIINQILENNEIKLNDIEIVTPKEKDEILNIFNNTVTSYPNDKTIVDLFEDQVKKTPNKTALVFENKKLTYSQLNKKANQLAHYLINQGVQKGDTIGILVNRSLEMIIGLIAILKTGSNYLPIDPDYPQNRIEYMINDSNTKTILVNNKTQNTNIKISNKFNIELESNIYDTDMSDNLNLEISPESLMYIIYTSGSTGKPKGVMLTHKNINNFLHGMKEKIDFSPQKVMVSVTTISFDIFGLECWGALTNGLKLILANEQEQNNANLFNSLCVKYKANIIQTTPSRFSMFLSNNGNLEFFNYLTDILVGGEPLRQKLLTKLKQYSLANIYNMYGPTETAVWSTIKNLSKTNTITIGYPIINTKCYILDKNHKLLPKYTPGELYIGGDGVSNGYLNQPELTSKKFINSPFNNEIIYNTNDLAYINKSGEIIYLGRDDSQVKIRGYRIELGEVENTICNYDGINSCAVITSFINRKNVLCAYYTAKDNISPTHIKNYLLSTLPTYMIPNYFIQLDKLPYTPNGKIDKKVLANNIINTQKHIIQPKNVIEQKLYDIVYKLTQNKQISMDDDLFSIGLDSISIIRLSSIIQSSFDIYISIKDLYNVSSLSDLCSIIKNNTTTLNMQIPKRTYNSDYYELSDLQKDIFYAYQMNKNSLVYNVSCGLSINSLLNKEKIIDTFEKIIELQPSFRTYFKIIDNKPCQIVAEEAKLNINFYNTIQENKQNIVDNFPKPFDLENAPLLRIEVYFINNKETLILIDSHHIIMDGTSLSILVDNFRKYYNNTEIQPLTIDYIDYTLWSKEFSDSSIDNYWLSKFSTSELPLLNLPYDYPASNIKSFNGNSIDLKIDENIFKSVSELAKQYKISPYTFFVSIFYILLNKYTGQNDIIIGTPMDVRSSKDLYSVIGMFVNNVLLRNVFELTTDFETFLVNTHAMVKEAITNQPYYYENILKHLNLKNNSLLDVVFTYQTPQKKNIISNNFNFETLRPNTKTSKFKLLLEIIPDMNTIRLEYNTDLFKYETANSFIKHYEFLLNNLIKNQNQKISEINIITPEEQKLLNSFNNTYEPINSDTIMTLFERIVNLYPENIALVCNDIQLTYSDLNKKSNSLADYLIKKGIGRNDIVCIMTNRSLETVICMLGILKAGAAFFNVDPTYPIERTKYYLQDSKTKYVLTMKSLKDQVSQIENCIEIDLSNEEVYNNNTNNPYIKVEPTDLSYIIYTSGSTGTPKGVMLNQVGFVNMAKAMTKVLDYLKDGYKHTIVSVTSTPFDIFVYEIFVSLTHGLKVVMANNAEHRNPKLLDELIKKYNVDVMTVTPSLMKINYDNREQDSALALVKNMVFGGEPLPEKFVKDLKSLADDITIYNIYGPSEITILSNVQNLEGETEITVGPPIMNTQIHILDNNMKPVPIGVIGEIYISGIQVGLGYIGKPEMTATRFLDNPFGSGKIYKSGDIGRWTFDGKVQCLGRIDNQIKLRGLRIELGEIENVLSNIPGITASVVNKIEIEGKEALCAYYVSNPKVDESIIRETLRKSLPQYMVPSYIVHLESMPYTINRKIDRKSLPLPNLQKTLPSEKININELATNEEKLLQVWKNILKIDDITINDNFFDLGGDSISAIQMQIDAIKYGLKFEYADIFNYPTIKELSNKIPKTEIDFIQDYNYTKINNVLAKNNIDNLSSIKPAQINNILLIGSTGFIGAHIIDQFMSQNTGKIYCIVRIKNNIEPSLRLKETLQFYFGNSKTEEYFKRIIVITGDITKPNLGLTDDDYNLIKNNVDAIINSGAIVKHYGLKQQFNDINVLGTQNVVDFCKCENKRLLHISTISVSGQGEKEEAIEETEENIKYKKQFSENNIFVGQKIKGIYTITKYKAELIVLEAINDGLNAQILRLGNITNRYTDGIFQQNIDDNAFAKRIKSFIEIGAIPKYMLKHAIELTPVDLAADAIIKIMNTESNCNMFHIYNTKLMDITLLLKTLKSIGYDILPMKNEMLSFLITGILYDNNKKDILSGIIYDLDDKKKLIYTYDVRLHADFTNEYLKKISFEWKEIDENYIIRYMNYFKKINFIKKGDVKDD